MANLTQASKELFRREPDERFSSLESLMAHCHEQRENSHELWQPIKEVLVTDALNLSISGEDFGLSNWSFSQLCKLHGVDRKTVNRVSRPTAAQVLRETTPESRKPFQFYGDQSRIRAIHGTAYSRLYNAEILEVVMDAAPEFTAPPAGVGGATGLYAGEEDTFAFLIDPNGWVEIEDEQFAPGFFVWNSEVGRRSVGIQTFFYQKICSNHIVWNVTDVCELTRKHVGSVEDALHGIRDAIATLVNKRDEHRDKFAQTIKQAFQTRVGEDAEETQAELQKLGFGKKLVEEAIELVPPWSHYSVFAVVDSLTRLSQRYENAGDRLLLDQKAGALLSAAA